MILAWVDPGLSQTQRAVRDHFAKGSSFLELLLLLLAAVVCGVLLFTLRKRQEQSQETEHLNDPERLFQNVIAQLAIPDDQQRLLNQMAQRAKSDHPVTMLMSPKLFDLYVARWRARSDPNQDPATVNEEAIAAQLRDRLFPADDDRETADRYGFESS